MSGTETVLDPGDVVSWVREQSIGSDRFVFGIAGPPGSGKSTMAAQLAEVLFAPVVPMDGFHLPTAMLRARGQIDVKGAPETFAAEDFVALVRELRDGSRTVRCPSFDRTIDEPIVDRIRVEPADEVVIVEGNYLLLDRPPWSSLAGLFDSIAYLDVPAELRRRRLIARHVEFGRSPAEAADFVDRSDARNGLLVEASRDRADVLIRTTC